MKSTRSSGMVPVLGALVAILVAFSPGCSGKDDPGSVGGTGGSGAAGGAGGTGGDAPKHCIVSDDCDADERCDQETKLCVPRCTADNQCPRHTGTYCDIPSGECVPAEHCQDDATCGSTKDFDYCSETGTCICIQDDSVPENMKGICWRVASTCQPCSADVECGNSGAFKGKEADCRVFRVGDETSPVCLPRENKGRCPPGMVAMDKTEFPELDGYCMPQSGDCATNKPCMSNDDCTEPSAPVCDLVRQICVAGCSVDFQASGATIGCPPDQVCHATTAGMKAENLERCETAGLFGIGECGMPCSDDSECKGRDPNFVCKSDGSMKRCRPAGCIDDSECEDLKDPNSMFLPWCDVATNTCVTDRCRAGFDPRLGCGTDKTYQDCASQMYKCTEVGTTGEGVCEEKNCIDLGGKEVGCFPGHFCDGEQYKSLLDGSKVDKVVSIPDATPGECVAMDVNLWCGATCQAHTDCANVGPNPEYKDSPSICMDQGIGPSCFWGCEYDQECPSSWKCSSQGLELYCSPDPDLRPNAHGLKTCTEDAECGPGNRCVEPMVNGEKTTMGLEPFKVCECSNTGVCGGNYSCNAGLGPMVKFKGFPGYEEVEHRYCVDSSPCGLKGGSCEWFGEVARDMEGLPVAPILRCGATPDDFAGSTEATCPAIDAVTGLPARRGKTASDRYACVYSQVCLPGYFWVDGEQVCGVQE
ncbi:MAG TPA: hypothetical protein VN033_00715 [Vulgatibacter sp.]|nr:hypothetical protein [Vulgatibacter sp.]